VTAVACRPTLVPRRRPVGPVGSWDWSVLVRPRVVAARVIAAVGFAALAWTLRAPAVLPAVVAFPLAEALVAAHAGQARVAFTAHDDVRAATRYLRVLGRRVVLALVPPLLVAAALLAAGRYLPADRPLAHTTALHAAVGVLCAGGYGLILLLAAAGRLAEVLVLAALAAVAAAYWPPGVLGGYLAGVVLAAAAVSDPRRYRPTLGR
jgi:hypothetical protein